MPNTTQNFKVISVEGNIAVGKSTLLPKLAAELTRLTGEQWVHIKEAVDEDPEFQRLLLAFTQDPLNNRVEFQNYMTNLRHGIGLNLKAGTNYILERSLLSDLVFSLANHIDGQDDAHIQYIHECLQNYTQINTAVYLQADPRICHQRMLERARDAESGTPLEYLTHIANCHDKYLPEFTQQYNVPLLTLDYTHFMPVQDIAHKVLASCEANINLTRHAA